MLLDSRVDIYARGYQTFMGLKLRIQPGVLIPREETELLGETACDLLKGIEYPLVIDMCAGSGNLACALATRIPGVRVWAADAFPECVRLTELNVNDLGLQHQVQVSHSDLFEALRGRGLENTVDLVMCNPPYIPSSRLDSRSSWLLESEPRGAFDGGSYGIDIMSRVVRDAPAFLRENGVLAFEFGVGQHQLVRRLLDSTKAYDSIRMISNAEGVPRVAVACKSKATNLQV
jgi:release factor glutamine methyltransferase